jgi:endo-1,4-beta-xylanase
VSGLYTQDVIASADMKRRALLSGSFASALCSAARVPLRSLTSQSDGLRAIATARATLVGSEISNQQLQDAQIEPFVKAEFNILAAENQMSWTQIHPGPASYDFASADELLEFAKNNSLALRGRTLCQNTDLPSWVEKEANQDNAAQMLRQHIQTTMGRYVGRIHSWDVLSEAVEPDDQREDGMRNSVWMKLLGLRYIAIAFQTAAETDHKAILTYNERGLVDDSEASHHRRLITIGFLRWFRTNRIPIHALGLQSHLRARYDNLPNWVHLHAFLREVGKLELQVFITGLEIDDTDLSTKPEKRGNQVAELCRDYLSNVLKHSNVAAVMTTEPVSHVVYETDSVGQTEKRYVVLPLSENLQPTPLFGAMAEAIRKRREESR